MNNKKVVSVIAVLMAVLMVLSLVLSVLPIAANAVNQADIDAIEKQKDALTDKRTTIQEKIDALKEQQASVLEQKAALDERNEYTAEQLKLVQEQINIYNGLIKEKSKEVDAAKKIENEQLQRYRERVCAMEESGGYGYNLLAIIFNSGSFGEMLAAIDDMSEVMQSDRKLEQQYIDARKATESVKAEYEEAKAGYEEKQSELKAEQTELKDQLKEAEELLSSLEDDIEKAVKEYEVALAAEAAMAAEMSNLAAQLAREAAEEAARREQESQGGNTGDSGNPGSTGDGSTGDSGSTGDGGDSGETPAQPSTPDEPAPTPAPEEPAPTPTPTPQPSSPVTGSLMWPVPSSNLVTSRYGWRVHPITGTERFHAGIDINGYGNAGGVIYAADGGTVVRSRYSDSYGNYVMINHDGNMQTLYAHMSGTAVSEGQTVNKGDVIGYLGETGWATGVHCHFEVYVGGSTVDPEGYFPGLPHWNC